MPVKPRKARDMPDRRDGLVYVMPEDLLLAVEVAKATGRPLLLRGNPGSGKSSLAPYVARELKWSYYEYVVTSQTRATDLLWKFDGVRRLADAQMTREEHRHAARRVTPRKRTSGPRVGQRQHDQLGPDEDVYTQPGPLWWAYAPTSAAEVAGKAHQARAARRQPIDLGATAAAEAPAEGDGPWVERWNRDRKTDHAVVLIDEIDKADPDVPNGLLVPLASHDFTVTETGRRVIVEPADDEGDEDPDGPFHRHLVIITTNEERELPQAFLRRCVIATAPEPSTVEQLVAIAEKHLDARLGSVSGKDRDLAKALARELLNVRNMAMKDGIRPPSTAEYLDALWACRALKIKVGDSRWDRLTGLTLIKPQHLTDKG